MRCLRTALAVALVVSAGAAHGETMLALNPPMVATTTTISNLPACTAALTGVVYRVTDALLPVLGAVVGGGGAVSVVVRCNGTSYLVGQ